MARKRIDITGQRFGGLTVLGYSHVDVGGQTYWRCLCDCGNKIIARAGNLKNGHTRSCGCLQREKAVQTGKKSKRDLTGQKFGRLTVLEDTGKRAQNGSIAWLCQCDCGNTAMVSTSNLTGGRTLSCGCLHFWKGGITPENTRIRNSTDYSHWRQEVFARDNWTCQVCGQKGGKLHAHHLEAFNNNPKLRIEIDNGITLCKKCHENFHHLYGRGNNTREQFEKFLKPNSGEVYHEKDWSIDVGGMCDSVSAWDACVYTKGAYSRIRQMPGNEDGGDY